MAEAKFMVVRDPAGASQRERYIQFPPAVSEISANQGLLPSEDSRTIFS